MFKKTIFFILAVLLLATISFAAPQTSPSSVKGKITRVDTQYNFVIVNLGEKEGLKVGSFLRVLRQDKEIAKLEVIKVRQTISAAEIRELKTWEPLQTEDTVVLVVEPKPTPASKEQKAKPEKGKEGVAKPAPKEKPKEVKAEKGKKEAAKPAPKKKAPTVKQLTTAAGVNMRFEGDKNIAEADIKAAPSLVFDAANILLRDRGFIVTVANREAGLLMASKGLLLSRREELWAGLTGAIDHELVFSIQIKESSNLTHLEISISSGYLKKDQYRKRIVKDNSYIYKEAIDLISEIKNWTEGLAGAAASTEKKAP